MVFLFYMGGYEMAKTTNVKSNPQIPSKLQLRLVLGKRDLRSTVVEDHLYEPIFVTDKFGNCILNSDSTHLSASVLGVSPQELVGRNVEELVQAGIYDWSPTLKAIETRSVISGLLKTGLGANLMATSTPIMNENGDIIMVVTNFLSKDVVENFMSTIKKERGNIEQDKKTIEHLNKGDKDRNRVVAESQQMKKIIKTANNIAMSDSTVILTGESGTGKEVIARYIHRNSQRASEPFIPVNCAAIPNELFESEFFGYARGAYTGANSHGKPGLFELADKGTLFLDEIEELPLAMQSKLLRVLETGEIQSLGSSKIKQTNVRLITASNRDLKEMVCQKQFRHDLYYRINVVPIYLPPLRERQEDIIVLANHFLAELNNKYGLNKAFSPQTVRALIDYKWPGNVRELRNAIEKEFVTSAGDSLNVELEDIRTSPDCICIDGSDFVIEKVRHYNGTLKSLLQSVEKKYIKQVLEDCNGRIGDAAHRLGIHRSMLYRKLNKKTDIV
jgi:transcriptional regulator with PAS, ATPase and Fis domain